MCGIAGYSLPSARARRPDARRPGAAGRDRRARRRRRRLRLPRARGRVPDGRASSARRRQQLLERIAVPAEATPAARPRPRLHEGPPVDRGQQPSRSATGRWSGSTTGIILNDDELLARHACARAEPRMTRRLRGDLRRSPRTRGSDRARARGSSAARWRPPGSTSASRASLFSPAASAARSGSAGPRRASSSPRPSDALEIAERTAGLRLRKREVAEGTLARARRRRGRRAASASGPTRLPKTDPLPAVRAPHEREFCLARLAALAAG